MKDPFVTPVKLMLLLSSVFLLSARAEEVLTLERVIAQAEQNDPWLQGNQLKQSAMEARSVASGSLPDPSLSVALANLPTDTGSFSQEGMTQFKVGVTQMFPRGESLAIREEQLKIASNKFPLLRADRKAKIRRAVSLLWLDAYLAQRTIELIENDRALFEQMADVVRANYSHAVGSTRQQDVIRAQLELVQLDDRLTEEKQKFESALARLNEWLALSEHRSFTHVYGIDGPPLTVKLPLELPSIEIQRPSLLKEAGYTRNDIAASLLHHPAVLAIDIEQKVAEKAISLSRQQYKPQWGVNASYGYRDSTPTGNSRADLFSVGVTLDLPLFTENKQDKLVAASIAESEAVKTDKLLLIKQMLSFIETELTRINRLSERASLYENRLLRQTHDQAEASLTAYTNDDGDFAEVVRARIAELNTKVSSLKIDVEMLKSITRINYYLTQATASSQAVRNPHFGEE